MLLHQRGYDLSLFGSRPTRLIRPGWKSDRLDFARAQAGGATATHYDGTQWREDTADTPRFGPALKSEGQRTNGIRNPRADGLVSGTYPAWTLPTYWSIGAFTNCAVALAAATESGLSAVDITITPSGAGGGRIQFDAATVSSGQATVGSVFAKRISASLASLASLDLRVVDLPSANITATSLLSTGTGALGTQRPDVKRTVAGADTSQRFEISWTHSAAGAAATIRIAVPQHELASFASTPILPATTGSATRGADLLSAPLNGARRGLVLWSGLWGQNAPSGVDQMALQIDDGTDANRFRVRNAGGGATVVAGRVASSASADLTSLGNMTAGAMTALGLAFDLDTGAYKAVLRGGTVRSGTGGPTSATRLRFGTDAAGANAQFGEIGDADFIPGVYPSDAEIAARVDAMRIT